MSSAEPIISSSGRPVRRCRAQLWISEGKSPHLMKNSARKRSQRSIEAMDRQNESLIEGKKMKTSSVDVFSSHMTDDTFLFLLRYFVADTGLVDGDSIGSVMCVSKRWYAVASSQALWTVPVASMEGESRYSSSGRPSPMIRDVRLRHESLHLSNLVGFSNLGRRTAEFEGVISYRVRERATGLIFNIDILDADDCRFIRSAASAHRLLGDDFLGGGNNDDSLYLPAGIDISNGKVVRWFEHSDPLPTLFRRLSESASPLISSRFPLPLPVLKNWFRQIFQAVGKIHATGAVHGFIAPWTIYLDSSDEPSRTSLKVACPALYPAVSADVASKLQDSKYTCPELLIARSKDLLSIPTTAGDIWSIGCVLAEIVRHGVPLFGADRDDLDRELHKIWRMVGRPSSRRRSLRNNFPLDPMENLQRELKALNEEGLDFLRQLLSPDPETRPTAEEALAHPFLLEGLPSESIASPGLNPNRELISIYLLLESQNQVSPSRKHVRVDAWATLVDYIIEIAKVFDLKDAAAFRAMTYFDRFFSSYQGSSPFTSRRCQLIAGTCLYIASMCDTAIISKTDLAFCADNTFDCNDVLIAEEAILRGLDWRLSYPTILDFVEMYANVLDLKEHNRFMPRYIAELALQCQIYLTYQPSLVASCVVALASYCVGTTELWPAALEEATGYSWLDLEQCMLALSSDIHHVRSTMPELKIIMRRYRGARNGRVALVQIPRITSFALMRNPRSQNA